MIKTINITFKALFLLALVYFTNVNIYSQDKLKIMLKNSAVESIGMDSLMQIKIEKITGVKDKNYAQGNAFPNPFSDKIQVEIVLENTDNLSNQIEIKIFNSSNQFVAKIKDYLFDNSILRFTWDGKDGNSILLSTGSYYWQFVYAGNHYLGKIILER